MQLGDSEEPPELSGLSLGIPTSRSTRTLRAGADSTKPTDTEMERGLSGGSVESGFTDPDEKAVKQTGDQGGSVLAGVQFPPHRRSNTAEEESILPPETPPRRHGASLPRSATRKSENKPLPIFPAALQRSPPLGLEEENSGQGLTWGGQQRGRRDSDAAVSESLSSSVKKKVKRQSWNPFKSSIRREPSPAQDGQHQHSASLSASPRDKPSLDLSRSMMPASQVPVTPAARAEVVVADANPDNKKHKRAQSSLSLAFGFPRAFSRTTSARSKLQKNPSASSSTLSLVSVNEGNGIISTSPPTLQLEIPRATPFRTGSGGSDPVEELASAHSGGSSRQSETQRAQAISPTLEMPPPPPPVVRQRVTSPGHESRPSDGSSNLTQSSHEMSSRSNSRSNSSSAYTQGGSSILSAEDRAASRRFFAMSRKGSESTQSSEASMAGTSFDSHGRKTSLDLSGTSRPSPISSSNFVLDHQRRSSAQATKDHRLVNSDSIATIQVQKQQAKPTPPPKSPFLSGKENMSARDDKETTTEQAAEGHRPSMGIKSQSETFVRRNSLGDLRIPSRISQAQQGLRTNIGLVRDFAQGIGGESRHIQPPA